MELFDTHFHLNSPGELGSIVAEARDAGVTRLLLAGASVSEMNEILLAAEPFPEVYTAAGVHPHEAELHDGDMTRYQRLLGTTSAKAVGEIGLDYFYDNSPRQRQKEVFSDFLELANDMGLPAIVHVREAHEDAYEILGDFVGNWRHSRPPFVIHCFSGNGQWARKYLDLGGYLSFTGIVTFPKAEESRDALKVVPLERLMLETDSPYLAPVPKRGRPNKPAYVAHVNAYVADVLNVTPDEMARITTRNACHFFQC
jgi:TatD DNase family protein